MAKKIPLKDFPKFLREVEEKLGDDLKHGVTQSAWILAGHIAETIMAEIKAPSKATIRTGALARSYIEGVKFLGEKRGKLAAKTTSRLPYARIQNEGGFIKPSTRRNLAVPLTREAAGRWPRDWGSELQLFVNKRKGQALLGVKTLKGTRGKWRWSWKFHYVLRKWVYIEPKYYLERAQVASYKDIGKELADTALEPFKKAG